MAKQLPLGYADRFNLMFDRAGAEQADRLQRYSSAGAAQTLARTADDEAARIVGLAAGDIASREAGVGAVEGMSGRPTDVDFADSATRRFASTPSRSVPTSKAAEMQATLGRLRRMLQSGAISQAEYTAEVARAEAAMRLPEGARGTSPGGVASEYGRPTSPGGIRPSEARATSPDGIRPYEARRTFPGSDVLDAPSGPRDSTLRLTDAGTDVSQNYQASRVTSSGEPLQRARQAARVADPEFGRATEPFMPGTQQARLNEARPTVVDRTPFPERPTTAGESVRARSGTPTTIDRTPFTERPTTVGESSLARRGTPTVIDEARQLQKALRYDTTIEGADQAMSILDDVISRAQTSRGGRMAAGMLEAVKAMPTVQRAVPYLAKGARLAGRAAGPLAVASTAYDAYKMGEALEQTQDPIEQLRFVYEQQGSQPLKIGRGGVSRDAMEKLAQKDPVAFFKAIDQGILDASVGYLAQGAVERPGDAAPAAKPKVVLEDQVITADAPQAAKARKPVSAKPAATGDGDILRVGARGAGVRDLQSQLRKLDLTEGLMNPNVLTGQTAGLFDLGGTGPGSDGVDGSYGGKTKAAVEAFQKRAGIEATGVADAKTLAELSKAVDASAAAAKLQRSQKKEIADMPAPGVDETAFDALEFEDMKDIDPVKSDRRTPTQNTEAYLDLELDEEPRRTAFPLYRSRRDRK